VQFHFLGDQLCHGDFLGQAHGHFNAVTRLRLGIIFVSALYLDLITGKQLRRRASNNARDLAKAVGRYRTDVRRDKRKEPVDGRFLLRDLLLKLAHSRTGRCPLDVRVEDRVASPLVNALLGSNATMPKAKILDAFGD